MMDPQDAGWGRQFDPDRLASLELAMWKRIIRTRAARDDLDTVMIEPLIAEAKWNEIGTCLLYTSPSPRD